MNAITALRVARIVGRCVDRAGKKKNKKKNKKKTDDDRPPDAEDTMIEEEESRMPWTIIILMAVLIVLHLYHSYVERQVHVAIKPNRVYEKEEYYRLITHALFHNSHAHLLFNLWAMWNCSWVEHRHGSVWLALVTLESALLTSGLYVSSASTLSHLPKFSWLWKRAVRGFSGVLFHWGMLKLQRKEMWSVRGLFTVHRKYYPFASALLIHLMNSANKQTMKQAGSLLHCCGIAIGYLHVNGYLSWIMPSEEFADRLERWVVELVRLIGTTVEKYVATRTPLCTPSEEAQGTVLGDGHIRHIGDNGDEAKPRQSRFEALRGMSAGGVLVDESSSLPVESAQGEKHATISLREARLRRFSPDLLQQPKRKTE